MAVDLLRATEMIHGLIRSVVVLHDVVMSVLRLIIAWVLAQVLLIIFPNSNGATQLFVLYKTQKQQSDSSGEMPQHIALTHHVLSSAAVLPEQLRQFNQHIWMNQKFHPKPIVQLPVHSKARAVIRDFLRLYEQ